MMRVPHQSCATVAHFPLSLWERVGVREAARTSPQPANQHSSTKLSPHRTASPTPASIRFATQARCKGPQKAARPA